MGVTDVSLSNRKKTESKGSFIFELDTTYISLLIIHNDRIPVLIIGNIQKTQYL